MDVNNNPVDVENYAAKLTEINNWHKEGNTYTTELAYTVDANYTFSFDYTDKSDNKMEFSYAEDAVATEEFTVDTVKPEITLSTSIPIVYRILNALTFGIFNPEAKVVITTTDLTSGIDYVTYQSTSVEGKEIGNIDIKTVKSSEMQINDVLKEKAVYSFNIPAEFRNTLIAYGWEFLFIGANIDAVETASHFGINEDRAVNYHADSQGTSVVYDTVADTVGCMRACTPIASNWSDKINKDFNSRK